MNTVQQIEIGILLRKIRVANRFSQQHVARHLNISRNAYANWENGKTEISLSSLDKICELYKINVQDIFTYPIKHKQYNSPIIELRQIRENAPNHV